jgi:hypothetical protein
MLIKISTKPEPGADKIGILSPFKILLDVIETIIRLKDSNPLDIIGLLNLIEFDSYKNIKCQHSSIDQ